MSPRVCPTCKKPLPPGGSRENPAFPFCSERCKLEDLGKWLREEYRVPAERAGDGGGPGDDDE